MIKVMLVDDHDLVRTGIKRLLSDAKGIKVVAEAASGEEAVKTMKDSAPDVVLMDVKMPGIGGLEATRKMLRLNPGIKILIVTIYDEDPFPSRLLQAGAAGYITKGAATEEMVKAIHGVHLGQRYISPEIAQHLALKHLSETPDSPFETLSDRELQVMMMITQGQTVQDISDKLCLSTKTINSYRYRIFEKFTIKTDVELTHLAIRYGLLDSDESSE